MLLCQEGLAVRGATLVRVILNHVPELASTTPLHDFFIQSASIFSGVHLWSRMVVQLSFIAVIAPKQPTGMIIAPGISSP
jgi:hypothetical protein